MIQIIPAAFPKAPRMIPNHPNRLPLGARDDPSLVCEKKDRQPEHLAVGPTEELFFGSPATRQKSRRAVSTDNAAIGARSHFFQALLAEVVDLVGRLTERFFAGQADLASAVDADDLDQQLLAFLDDVGDVVDAVVRQLAHMNQTIGAG
jgi:hypothetical protein